MASRSVDSASGHRHYTRPRELPFFAKDRARTTLLLGGLTEAHEIILVGHLQGLGYRVERLPVPDQGALRTGKEFCNRGQCNPTYYTVGNLVNRLKALAAETSVEEVERDYVFMTAGSCGPCRFGMYESEYRKAIVDAGFRNFRVFILQQAQGLNQLAYEKEKPGIDINKEFFVGFFKAILLGDCINQIYYKIKPYELEEGAADSAKADAMPLLAQCMRDKQGVWAGLRAVGRRFDEVGCDFTRVKPKIKITGEFWASITEGDGNYFIKRWLQEEGAEVVQEPLTGWIEHLLFSREIKAHERRGMDAQESTGLGEGANPYAQEAKLFLLRLLLNGFYNGYRAALGFKPSNTISNRTMANEAHRYYNKHQGGGEAYMEVGSLVYCAKKKKVHMLLSVKPFGCLPSTASDGVQSKVTSDYPGIIFLAAETSGDSEVNFKSRVQMKLFEAKQKAKDEAAQVVENDNIDLKKVSTFVDMNPQYKRAMYLIRGKSTSTGASFIADMHWRMHSPLGRLAHLVSKGVCAVSQWRTLTAVIE